VAAAVQASFDIPAGVTGIVLAIATAAVIIGGIKSIGRVTGVLVPIMIIFYVIGALVILALHIGEIPAAFSLIVTQAFNPTAATGGFAGAGVMMAIRMGVARGVFSNESGLGSAPIAAAAAKTKHPVTQALVSMTQTFIDTIVVCTMTGLVIIISGAWTSGKNGAELTSVAFDTAMPGNWGGLIVTLSLILFAYSTIIGWCYYGEKSMEYLWGEKVIKPYRFVWVLFVALGAVLKLDLVWNISDVFNGLMAFPNLVALLMLSPVIAKETREYFSPEKERLRV
jgi:AGCS family alanine or glycine:cation symporter